MSDSEVGGRKENTIAKTVRKAPGKPDGTGTGTGLKSAVEDYEEAMRMRDLLRRSITTLCSLVISEDRVVNDTLSHFKKTAQRDAAIEEMEKSLKALRDAIVKSGDSDQSPSRSSGASPNRPQDGPRAMVADGVIDEFKSIFLGLVGEFDQDFGEEYAGRVRLLRGKIEKSTRIEDVVKLERDIVGLVEIYNQAINEERNLVTEFITEMGGGLLELERQYLDTINQTGHSHTENKKFNSLVEIQVEDMKKSAQLSTTLAEFRDLVLLRLAAIRSALEEKRRSEVLRQERLNEEMDSLNQNLSKMKKEVDQVHEKRKALEKEVLIDSLTGVANRRALKERLKTEMYRFERYGQAFSLVVLDLDKFKSINDQYGHWAGDRCLKEIVKQLKPMLRETDLLGRWGGDEFVMVFSATCLDSAVGVADRLRKMIQNTRFVYHKQEISLTISVGVTEVMAGDQTMEAVFNRADKAMYKSKKAGGNAVNSIADA